MKKMELCSKKHIFCLNQRSKAMPENVVWSSAIICSKHRQVLYLNQQAVPMNTAPPTLNSKLTTDSKLYTLNSKLNTHLHQIIILSKHPPILRDKHRGINRIPFEPLNDSLREIHPSLITERETTANTGIRLMGK